MYIVLHEYTTKREMIPFFISHLLSSSLVLRSRFLICRSMFIGDPSGQTPATFDGSLVILRVLTR